MVGSFNLLQYTSYCSCEILFRTLPQMAELEPQQVLCSFVGSVTFYAAAVIFMCFGYRNNAWLVVRAANGSSEYQRGIGDDCYRISDNVLPHCVPWGAHEPFPPPFHHVIPPAKFLHISAAISRVLLIVMLFWLSYSIACCCNKKVEIWSRNNIRWPYSCGAGTLILFVMIVLLNVIALTSQSVLEQIPQGADFTAGTGFYTYVVGGILPFSIATYMLFMKEINERINGPHQRVPVDISLTPTV